MTNWYGQRIRTVNIYPITRDLRKFDLAWRTNDSGSGWRRGKPDPLSRPEGVLGRSRISSGILVEAGGIEPPSEDAQESATTRLFRALELAIWPPADALPHGQPVVISDTAQSANDGILAR